MTISSDALPAPTRRTMLRLEHVGVAYQRRSRLWRRATPLWALRDVSLTLHEGETLGVIGRNGAGKSTLLRLLAGILRHDQGEFTDNGHSVALLSLQLGFVDYLSGRENAMLSGLLMGMARSDIENRLERIIAFAELEEFIDEPIATYSSGMRARLGFATAVFIDPDVLLIDEVLGVGDAEFVEKSKKVMRERIRSDKTVVLVSHSAQAVRELCDRAVWLHKGRTMMEGDADAVVEAYERSLAATPTLAHPAKKGGRGR